MTPRRPTLDRYIIWAIGDVAGAAFAGAMLGWIGQSGTLFGSIVLAFAVAMFATGATFILRAAYHLGRAHAYADALRSLEERERDS